MKRIKFSSLTLSVVWVGVLISVPACRLGTNNPEKLEALKAGYEYDENGIVISPSPSPSPSASSDPEATLQYTTSTSNLNMIGYEIEALSPTSTVLTGTITYSISPSLPSGLSISSTTGVISGTPTASSTLATYTVTARDDSGRTASGTVSLKVSQVSSIKMGSMHNCVIVDQSLYCWGSNSYGELGIGSLGIGLADSPQPISIFGGAAASMAGGRFHACAVKTDGTAWCWGSNASGQVGNNTATTHYSPVQVQGLPSGLTASKIAAGSATSCSIMSDGSVYCWGNNGGGRMGFNNATSSIFPPTQVYGMTTGATQITSAYDSHCALKSDGTAWCWGLGAYGAIGNNTATNQIIPKQVVGIDGVGLLSGVTQIAGGYYNYCAVLDTGALTCWGRNAVGALGDNTITNRNYPVSVVNMASGVTDVSMGDYHTCAIKNAAAYCWGMNSIGQLGDGTKTSSMIPVAVQGAITGVTQIAAGGYVNPAAYAGSCAIVQGALKCWGSNALARIGNPSLHRYWSSPTNPTGLAGGTIQSISAGGEQVCAAISGAVQCWGTNDYFQMGSNSVDVSAVSTPVTISGLTSGFTQVKSGRYTNCALRDDTSVWCWGYGGEGGLGNNTTTSSQAPVQALTSGATKLFVGFKHSCLTKADDSLWCWGPNSKGELGNNSTTQAKIPNQIYSSGIKLATVGLQFSCMVKTDDTVWCSGLNDKGQLGNNTTTNSLVYVQVQGLTASGSVTSIAAAYSSTCAIKGSSVYCWGQNGAKWAGNAAAGDALIATQVQNLQGTPSEVIRSGTYGACALMTDNSLWCWGDNSSNQFLRSSPSEYEGPTRVTPFSGTISKIDGGARNICAEKSGGTLWCWGAAGFGQLGNDANVVSTPKIVGPFIKP